MLSSLAFAHVLLEGSVLGLPIYTDVPSRFRVGDWVVASAGISPKKPTDDKLRCSTAGFGLSGSDVSPFLQASLPLLAGIPVSRRC